MKTTHSCSCFGEMTDPACEVHGLRKRCPLRICNGTGWVRLDREYSRCDCNPEARNSASDQGSYRNRALRSE